MKQIPLAQPAAIASGEDVLLHLGVQRKSQYRTSSAAEDAKSVERSLGRQFERMLDDVERKLNRVQFNLGAVPPAAVAEPPVVMLEIVVSEKAEVVEKQQLRFRKSNVPSDIAAIPVPKFKKVSLADEPETMPSKTLVLPRPSAVKLAVTGARGVRSVSDVSGQREPVAVEPRRHRSLGDVSQTVKPKTSLTRAAELRVKASRDRLAKLEAAPARRSSTESLSGFGSQRPLKKTSTSETLEEEPPKPKIEFFNEFAPLLESMPKTEPVVLSSEEVFLKYDKTHMFE